MNFYPSDTVALFTEQLHEIQRTQELHFQSLARERCTAGLPVFALEHALNDNQVKSLITSLRRCSQGITKESTSPFWLLWAIYASEIGYDYNGDEYWPKFKEGVLSWPEKCRPIVKDWFQTFSSRFNGVKPTGKWAEHFRIIAWPITHGLLPKNFQYQFVKLLYDLRFQLSSTEDNVAALGRMLAQRASHTTPRFQLFLEQKHLTGQIARAFLCEELEDSSELIYTPTLKRIVKDLGQIHSSRERLKDTRRVVSEKFQGVRRRGNLQNTTESPTSQLLGIAIRPSLCLVHGQENEWIVVLQFKSLASLANESESLDRYLRSTRCRLNGGTDWKPKGWLLSGNRQEVLRRWPNSQVPCIEFEHPDPLMDPMLKSDFRVILGSRWLFRIRRNGRAYLQRSLTVRPSNEYILISEQSSGVPLGDHLIGLEFTPCSVKCSGIHAFRFKVPDVVSVAGNQLLSDWGLELARTIRVWPAGLPGRDWYGEGHTEWLTTEYPTFGIAADFPLDSLQLRLNQRPVQVISLKSENDSTFVKLPRLPPGVHELTIEGRRPSEPDDAISPPSTNGVVQLFVREPEPWISGRCLHSGVSVKIDPFDASIDVLRRNELGLVVSGPKELSVSIELTLHSMTGQAIGLEPIVRSNSLPFTSEMWYQVFGNFIENVDKRSKLYEADSATLEINCGPIGSRLFRFDRPMLPLRWVWRIKQSNTYVRFIDDYGDDEISPEVHFYHLDKPLEKTSLDHCISTAEFSVDPPGGLYLVSRPPNFSDSLVVRTKPSGGFKGLKVSPTVCVKPGLPSIRFALSVLKLWYNARVSDLLANNNRCDVIRSIINEVIKTICGQNWAEAEGQLFGTPKSSVSTLHLAKLVDRRTQFGHNLQQLANETDETDCMTLFIAEAQNCLISNDHNLCRFALKLAACNLNLAFSDPQYDLYVDQLVDNPALLRGARLAVHLRPKLIEHLADTTG